MNSTDSFESRINPNQRHAIEDFEIHNLKQPAKNQDAGAHYRYEYRGIKIDPFRIAQIYGIEDFAMQTILKKVLRAGRAHKDLEQDLKDIICSAERKLEMLKEDLEK